MQLLKPKRDHNKQKIKILIKKISYIINSVKNLNEAIFSIPTSLKIYIKYVKSDQEEYYEKKEDYENLSHLGYLTR
mgnify:CR=1 FL=1